MGRAQQAVRIFANGVSNERAVRRQLFTQAQQRMQREASVCNSFPAAIAPVGQTMAQTPHPLHCPGSVTGATGIGFFETFSPSPYQTNRNLSNHESSGRGIRATSSRTKRPGSYPASLSRTFSPNLRASCKSATSGRPAATGVCGVLYECSPTNVPAATVTKPRSVMNRSKSSNACS